MFKRIFFITLISFLSSTNFVSLNAMGKSEDSYTKVFYNVACKNLFQSFHCANLHIKQFHHVSNGMQNFFACHILLRAAKRWIGYCKVQKFTPIHFELILKECFQNYSAKHENFKDDPETYFHRICGAYGKNQNSKLREFLPLLFKDVSAEPLDEDKERFELFVDAIYRVGVIKNEQKYIDEMLRKYPNLATETDTAGYSALHFAVFFDNPLLVSKLLKAGALVNAVGPLCIMPDMLASMRTRPKNKNNTVADMLNVALAKCDNKQQVLDRALQLVTYRLDKSNCSDAIVEYLLSKQADVNQKDVVPLVFQAAIKNRTDLIKLYIQAGADCNVRALSNTLPLTLITLGKDCDPSQLQEVCNAIEQKYGTQALVTLLNGHNRYGSTIQVAFSTMCDIVDNVQCNRRICGHVRFINYLKSKNIDINALDEDGYTALMAACNAGQPRVVQLLLGHQASVECLSAKEQKTAYALLQEVLAGGQKAGEKEPKFQDDGIQPDYQQCMKLLENAGAAAFQASLEAKQKAENDKKTADEQAQQKAALDAQAAVKEKEQKKLQEKQNRKEKEAALKLEKRAKRLGNKVEREKLAAAEKLAQEAVEAVTEKLAQEIVEAVAEKRAQEILEQHKPLTLMSGQEAATANYRFKAPEVHPGQVKSTHSDWALQPNKTIAERSVMRDQKMREEWVQASLDGSVNSESVKHEIGTYTEGQRQKAKNSLTKIATESIKEHLLTKEMENSTFDKKIVWYVYHLNRIEKGDITCPTCASYNKETQQHDYDALEEELVKAYFYLDIYAGERRPCLRCNKPYINGVHS